ncbi:MAG: aldehyde dehydrogenase family protein [Puniceicoccales bacterium]
MKTSYPFYVGNQAESPNGDLKVYDKYTDELIASVALADHRDIERAIQSSVQAAEAMRETTPFERRAVLQHCVNRFRERSEELADTLCGEAGKPIKDSRGEVARLIETFEIAISETMADSGKILNLEVSERCRGYRGFARRVPIGPCSFITPFNFPLNLVAHKVAPAIAAGCPFILKPDSRTPLGALIIAEILAETDLPAGAFSILPCEVSEADAFTTDPRLKLLSFTGSPKVGWELKKRCGKKKVVLELGGNAACIVDEGANIDDAVQRCLIGAFYQSGQSCISVQRIFLHNSITEEFVEKFEAATRGLKSGDPRDEDTFVGPLIDEQQAERLEQWIYEATASGARLFCGGKRAGKFVEPTVLYDVPRDQKLYRNEAFGPVVVLERFFDFDEVLKTANKGRYGIHTGVFTPRLDRAFRAWDTLEAGGVLINEMPSWRVDNLPYGGIKHSGIGREGVQYAIEEMSEIRTLILRGAD